MLLVVLTMASQIPNNVLPTVRAQAVSRSATIAPSTNWGPFFGTSGDVQIDINRTGIAVRVEIPREFLQGVVTGENDTHFIQTDITNDYYYYNVVDESNHWTYNSTNVNAPSMDGPCVKPLFSLRDPNAPWCVEIWDYLNGTFHHFASPKFVRFLGLSAPGVAGIYNFTLFVANSTNGIGYPDFVHAWNSTLFVPVSMSDDPASITGTICDADVVPPPPCQAILHDKGVVYAKNVNTQQIARAFVNQTTGQFNVTGLAPGSYVVQASAGLVDGVAYSLSDPQVTPITVRNGDHTVIAPLYLHRAPQVCGQITYERSPGVSLAHSFSDHPYLKSVLGLGLPGLKLNITIEATDPQGHTYRNQTTSLDEASDSFRIITGSNVTYVGTDPYGTEFAGLSPVTSGSYQLTLNVWITGYVQAVSETVLVYNAPGVAIPFLCNGVTPNPVIMRVGGVISGTIELRNLVTTETPNQTKHALGLGSIADLFGGNILIQAYDHSGILRGLVVNGTIPINGTLPNFAGDVYSIRFYVIGFSEYFNHTWSGVWDEKDSGLPADQAYTLKVYIRGYEQTSSPTISIPQGGNSTVTVPMTRGGLFQVQVVSYNNRFGVRVIQTTQPWRFANLPIPLRGRVYFYDSSGRVVGFVERLIKTGIPNGVGVNSFTILFAGQNWSLREIWFYGYVPTVITNDTYSIKAFTLGYVQLRPVNAPNDLTGFTRSFVALLIANNINVTAPIYANTNLLGSTPEHDYAIGQAFGASGLAGALPANLTANVSTLLLPLYGFGAMINVTCNIQLQCKSLFLGPGHFFYVSPDGTRNFDYGLDTGNYTAEVPEFGFNTHFTQISSPQPASFTDLSQGQGVGLDLLTMGKVLVGGIPNSLVTGWVSHTGIDVVPLSWVQVQAINASYSRSVPTLDGEYEGVGALFLPQGIYNITFTNPFFQEQSKANVLVTWSGAVSVLPPNGPLCPINFTCDPPTSLSLPQPQPIASTFEPKVRLFSLAVAWRIFTKLLLSTKVKRA